MHGITRGLSIALAVAGLLAGAGCAEDEPATTAATTTAPVTASSERDETTTTEDEGDVDEVCSLIEEIDDVQDSDFDEAIVLMDDARDAASEDMVDHWDALIAGMEDLAAAEGDPEAEEEVLVELFDDPDFLDAAAAIDDFAEEECGLDIELDPEDEAASTDDEIGVDDEPRPGDDEVGSSGEDDPMTLDAVQAYLAGEYASEDWWPVFEEASWNLRTGIDPTWTITLEASSDWETLSADDLVAACDAVAEHADAIEADEEQDIAVEVLDPDGAELVSRYFRGEACLEG
jgi:hypothetical protein